MRDQKPIGEAKLRSPKVVDPLSLTSEISKALPAGEDFTVHYEHDDDGKVTALTVTATGGEIDVEAIVRAHKPAPRDK